MTINIEWQGQNGNWHQYQSKQNQADVYLDARRRAYSTNILIITARSVE